jgi:hypothetical protein
LNSAPLFEKKGTLAERHCSKRFSTHSGRIGREPRPLSPPTMTQ